MRSDEDERYLQALGEAASGLVIYDARPYLNAHANRATGGGVENKGNYDNISVTFLNIENIHAMRNSWNTLQSTNAQADSKYLTLVENSNWLNHVSIVLSGAKSIAERLASGRSVLIHCSDGWDRTAQLCSLTQVFMDSYYRTIRGLAVLIEKDWVSFGHQFDKRLGHANPDPHDDQRSPIFIQFLDALRTVISQFPTHFEFNERLLLDLCYHAHSGRFGTFMGNCERDRYGIDMKTNTTSIWGWILDHTSDYINPYYQAGMDDPLFPCTSLRRMSVWEGIFGKWHPDCFYPLPGLLSPEHHRSMLMHNSEQGLRLYKAQLLEKDAEIQRLKQLVDQRRQT